MVRVAQDRTLDQWLPGRVLWLTWVAAHALGGLVGEVLARLVVGLLADTAALLLPFLLCGGSGLVIWLPLAGAQALLLRRMIPRFGRGAMARWVSASALGGAVAVAISAWFYLLLLAGFSALYLIGLGAIGGAIIGVSQWVLLRRYLLNASLWVGATALAWATALPLGAALVPGLLPHSVVNIGLAVAGIGSLFDANSGAALDGVFAGTLVIILAGAITGLTLLRLRFP